LASQTIWDSDKVVVSFKAVKELMMGGWFGGGGGGVGDDELQALPKSSAAMASKMTNFG
jgi:hypothetical protein